MKKLFTLMLSALFIGQAAAETDFAKLEKAASAKLGMEVVAIADSPFESPKLYQVSTERGLFYMSEDLRYLVVGKIYDTEAGFKDLTESALTDIRKTELPKLKGTTIDFVAPEQKHEVYVFTDISCGYCRKLHNEMQTYLDKGITVHYLAFPRGGPRSPAFETMNHVWCSKDKNKAITDAKSTGDVDVAQCNSPVAEHYKMGNQFSVTGTPAIVLPNGEMLPGYLPADRLLKAIETRS